MIFRRVDGDGNYVFQCAACKLVYLTEDHVPVAGKAV